MVGSLFLIELDYCNGYSLLKGNGICSRALIHYGVRDKALVRVKTAGLVDDDQDRYYGVMDLVVNKQNEEAICVDWMLEQGVNEKWISKYLIEYVYDSNGEKHRYRE